MAKGKNICKALKSIRKRIADENGIKYNPKECTYKGDCLGTCPSCEAEVRYIENSLHAMSLAGKAIRVVGFSLSLASITACTNSKISHTTGEVETVGTGTEISINKANDSISRNSVESTSKDIKVPDSGRIVGKVAETIITNDDTKEKVEDRVKKIEKNK